jgi:hypothetical protein
MQGITGPQAEVRVLQQLGRLASLWAQAMVALFDA